MGGGGYGGGYGGGSGGGGSNPPAQGNQEDRDKVQQLTGEVKNPSASLTISQSADSLAITDALGRTRFFQTTGVTDKHQLDAGVVQSTSKWNGPQLVTTYDLGGGRKLIYTYSLVATTKQLLVQVKLDGGRSEPAGGGTAMPIKQVYDPLIQK